jgi:hypothetical protein
MSTATGRQGFGFWDTTYYPTGGCFRRFGQDETVTDIEKLDRPFQGATHSGRMVRDGKAMTITFGIACVEFPSRKARKAFEPSEQSDWEYSRAEAGYGE